MGNIEDNIGNERCIRHDKISSGSVEGSYVAVICCPADDLHIRSESPTVQGEVDVRPIIMSSYDDGGFLPKNRALYPVPHIL